jgi:hypothetical protein
MCTQYLRVNIFSVVAIFIKRGIGNDGRLWEQMVKSYFFSSAGKVLHVRRSINRNNTEIEVPM